MKENSATSPHIISHETLVLEPFLSEDRIATKVRERSQIITVPRKPIHSIRKSCLYYGNSFKSATNSSRSFLRRRQKLPIVIAFANGLPIIALPMMSSKSEQNIWIFFHAIENFVPTKTGCRVYLINNESIDLMVSQSTIQRQFSLGTVLHNEWIKRYRRFNGPSLHDSY